MHQNNHFFLHSLTRPASCQIIFKVKTLEDGIANFFPEHILDECLLQELDYNFNRACGLTATKDSFLTFGGFTETETAKEVYTSELLEYKCLEEDANEPRVWYRNEEHHKVHEHQRFGCGNAVSYETKKLNNENTQLIEQGCYPSCIMASRNLLSSNQ